MKKRKIVFYIILSCLSDLQALKITEIFPASGKFFDPEEKFIEIYNNSDKALMKDEIEINIYTNSSDFITIKPGESIIVKDDNIFQINKNTIAPGETILIISKKFTNHLELIPFCSQTILFFPESETLWNKGWENNLEKIEVKKNKENLFSTGKLNLKKKDNLSFSLKDNYYIFTGLSPGNPGYEFITSSNLIVKGGDEIIIYVSSSNGDKINLRTTESRYTDELKILKEANLSYAKWKAPYGLKNGENVIFELNNLRMTVRFIDWNETSQYNGKVFINELNGDPKIDYSGGNWTGKDGGGIISSTDDWIELLNISDERMDFFSLYILEKTSRGESLKKLSLRTNFNDVSGKSISILTPENGLSEKALLYLFEKHPYKGGRVIDSLEYGKDFDGDGFFLPSLSSSSIEDETLSRIIQGTQRLPSYHTFIKTEASYGKINFFKEPYIFILPTNNTLEIFIYEPEINETELKIVLKNEIDEEDFIPVKGDFYYSCKIESTENKTQKFDGILSTGKGSTTKIYYITSRRTIETNWTYLSSGWEISKDSTELEGIVICPNPIQTSKRKVRFLNLPEGTEIFCLDNKGNILKKSKAEENYLEWEYDFKRGFYLVVFCLSGKRVLKRLLVY
ncbi:MAG: hypothetical protein ACP5QT_00695 [Brevinematia bacterium]